MPIYGRAWCSHYACICPPAGGRRSTAASEPAEGSIAVGRAAVIRAWLRDDSGIATNTIALTLSNRPPVTLTDARLQFAGGVLTYTPASSEYLGAAGDIVTALTELRQSTKQWSEYLGAAGDIVTASFTAGDTLGNRTTNFTWSFQLELLAVPNTNVVFIGGGSVSTARQVLAIAAPAVPGIIGMISGVISNNRAASSEA